MGAGTCGGVDEEKAEALQGLKMMRFILLLFLFGVSDRAPAQELSARRLKEIFRESRKGGKYTSWAACNTDSAYFTSDTVQLVQGGANYAARCCDLVQWSFRNGNHFDIGPGHCQYEILLRGKSSRIDLVENEKGLVAMIFQRKERIDEFRIIALERSNTLLPPEYRITMIRVK